MPDQPAAIAETSVDLLSDLEDAREVTLTLAARVDAEDRCRRVSTYYSPFDWHLGHIGFTEAYWVLDRGFQRRAPQPFDSIFANAPENPKERRSALPPRGEILRYLAAIRRDVLEALTSPPLSDADSLLHGRYCFYFALQHEWQHQETMAEIIQLLARDPAPREPSTPVVDRSSPRWVRVTAGSFQMGSGDPMVYDNERPTQVVDVPEFSIDETPVTRAQFGAFINDGGYKRQEFWEPAGWERVQAACPHGPVYTAPTIAFDGSRRPDSSDHAPVCGVNWYEASAYARWAGARLPTEAEWEKAATWDPRTSLSHRYPWGEEAPDPVRACFGLRSLDPVGSHPAGRSPCGALDMAGGVWEWTSTPFAPYPSFRACPYDGYSIPAFDGNHYVLKGGSWATQGPLLRSSFRNFYTPEYRQGFLGFRLAHD